MWKSAEHENQLLIPSFFEASFRPPFHLLPPQHSYLLGPSMQRHGAPSMLRSTNFLVSCTLFPSTNARRKE